ncbi:hypothetical protein [Micromonospora arborensis]|uniref:hypothetical protein n=1 Tax=Micromonospora arborensis TaxID=2116518 RepID=UPI0037244775
MNRADVVFVLGVVAVMLLSQFTARPVRPLTYLWVALLVARGCVPPGPARPTATGVTVLVAGLAISVVFGVLRGRTMPLWRDDIGRLYRRGDRVTLLLWLATFAVRLLVGGLGLVMLGEPVNLDALWLGIGVTFGVQQIVMSHRGRYLARDPAVAR